MYTAYVAIGGRRAFVAINSFLMPVFYHLYKRHMA